MKPSNELKMYTLRHFLFYMGVAAVLGVVVAALQRKPWGGAMA